MDLALSAFFGRPIIGQISAATAIVLAAVLLGVSLGAHLQISHLERDLRSCNARSARLEGDLDLQNKAVAALRRESDERTAAARDALARAEKSRQGAEVAAARVMGSKPQGDACAAALALGRRHGA